MFIRIKYIFRGTCHKASGFLKAQNANTVENWMGQIGVFFFCTFQNGGKDSWNRSVSLVLFLNSTKICKEPDIGLSHPLCRFPCDCKLFQHHGNPAEIPGTEMSIDKRRPVFPFSHPLHHHPLRFPGNIFRSQEKGYKGKGKQMGKQRWEEIREVWAKYDSLQP